MKIIDLRTELGLSQEEFAQRIGLSSKGNVSIIERENRCGLRVAVAIEALSDGRIDAATICEDVRLAREAPHAGGDIVSNAPPSPGNLDDLTAPARRCA